MKHSHIWIFVSCAAASLATGCLGGAPEEEPSGEELVVFNGGQAAIGQYGRTLLDNPGVECSAARAAGGALPILQLVTGRYAMVAGVGTIADDTVSIEGGSGSHVADGALALGAAGLWDGSTLQFGGALIGQYVVKLSATMPASEQAANDLFDEAFGPDARGGASLSNRRGGSGDRPRVMAWYTSGEATLPGEDAAPYSFAFGIVRTEGGVLAVHTTGFGTWQSYVE